MDKFETWWNESGQESLYALNTLTDADAKVLAEIAWEAALAEQAEQGPVQECRHCGWLCMPNHNQTKKAYVLQQSDVKAAALAEREACAKVCEELGEKGYVAEGCAAAIRARSEK